MNICKVIRSRLTCVSGTAILLAMVIATLVSCQPVATPNQPAVTPTPASVNPPATPEKTGGSPVVGESPQLDWVADGVISPNEYQQTTTFKSFSLFWSSDDDYIHIGMKAPTSGWIAIGFGAETLMKNADIIEGFVKDGKLSIVDMFSTGDFGPHPPDTQLGGTNDILDSAGQNINGFTIVEFKRKLDSGDKYDKPLLPGNNKIIWAYGTDPVFTLKHSAAGYGEIDIR